MDKETDKEGKKEMDEARATERQIEVGTEAREREARRGSMYRYPQQQNPIIANLTRATQPVLPYRKDRGGGGGQREEDEWEGGREGGWG